MPNPIKKAPGGNQGRKEEESDDRYNTIVQYLKDCKAEGNGLYYDYGLVQAAIWNVLPAAPARLLSSFFLAARDGEVRSTICDYTWDALIAAGAWHVMISSRAKLEQYTKLSAANQKSACAQLERCETLDGARLLCREIRRGGCRHRSLSVPMSGLALLLSRYRNLLAQDRSALLAVPEHKSTSLMYRVVMSAKPLLSTEAIRVALVLASRHEFPYRSSVVTVSSNALRKRTGCRRTTVAAAIEELRRCGILTVLDNSRYDLVPLRNDDEAGHELEVQRTELLAALHNSPVWFADNADAKTIRSMHDKMSNAKSQLCVGHDLHELDATAPAADRLSLIQAELTWLAGVEKNNDCRKLVEGTRAALLDDLRDCAQHYSVVSGCEHAARILDVLQSRPLHVCDARFQPVCVYDDLHVACKCLHIWEKLIDQIRDVH